MFDKQLREVSREASPPTQRRCFTALLPRELLGLSGCWVDRGSSKVAIREASRGQSRGAEEGPAPPSQFRRRDPSPRGPRVVASEGEEIQSVEELDPEMYGGLDPDKYEKLRNLEVLKYEGHNPEEEEEQAVLPQIR